MGFYTGQGCTSGPSWVYVSLYLEVPGSQCWTLSLGPFVRVWETSLGRGGEGPERGKVAAGKRFLLREAKGPENGGWHPWTSMSCEGTAVTILCVGTLAPGLTAQLGTAVLGTYSGLRQGSMCVSFGAMGQDCRCKLHSLRICPALLIGNSVRTSCIMT